MTCSIDVSDAWLRVFHFKKYFLYTSSDGRNISLGYAVLFFTISSKIVSLHGITRLLWWTFRNLLRSLGLYSETPVNK